MSELEKLQAEKLALEEKIRQLEAAAAAAKPPALAEPAQPQPSPQQTPTIDTVGPPRSITVKNNDKLFAALESCFELNAHGGNDLAFKHLTTIVTNILKEPQEKRFRRLKLDHPKLAAELWANRGSELFLRHLGFECEYGDPVQENVSQSDFLVCNKRDDEAFELALQVLDRLQERDQKANETKRKFDLFRRSVGSSIRMENISRHVKENTIEKYTIQVMIEENDYGSTLELLSILNTIVDNILSHPREEKFRRLKFSTPKLQQSVFPTGGSLEFLVGICKFHWTDEGISFPLADSTATSSDEQNALPHDEQLQLLQKAKALLSEIRAKLDSNAAEAINEEEFRKQHAEEEKRLRRELGAEKKKAPSSSSTAPAEGGRRVTIEEALNHLMGRDKE